MSEPRRKLSRRLSQRGGKNQCSYKKRKDREGKKTNRKYACNYGNIKNKRCPGYLVEKRKSDQDGSYYDLKWHHGGPDKNITGIDFTARKGTKLHYQLNGDPKSRERGNDTQCLPRLPDGKLTAIASRHKNEPNYYCKEYESIRGCSSNPATRPRRQGKVAEALAAQVEQPMVVKQSQRSSDDTAEQEEYDGVEKYTKKINGKNVTFWMHTDDLLEVKEIKKGPRKGNGLFAKADIPMGVRFPYLGQIKVRVPKDDDAVYVIQAGPDGAIIDGNPALAKTKNKAISPPVFANEPSTRQKPNAEFQHSEDGNEVFLHPLEDIKRGQEILVCYGRKYPRKYKTSCPKESPKKSSTSSSKGSSKKSSKDDEAVALAVPDEEIAVAPKLDSFDRDMIDVITRAYPRFVEFMKDKWPEIQKLQREDAKRDMDDNDLFWTDEEWKDFLTVVNGLIHLQDKSEKELQDLHKLQFNLDDNGNKDIYVLLELADIVFGPASLLVKKGIKIPDVSYLASAGYSSKKEQSYDLFLPELPNEPPYSEMIK